MRNTILTVVLALAAPVAAQDKQVTLGAAVQVTGPLSNTGRYYRDAYQFAIDRINAKGGITLGGAKARLALKLYDNQSDVNLGVRQYVRLVSQDKVDALLGPFSSNDALDDSSVAEKYQIPMVQGGGASSQIFSRGYKYIFGTLPPADDYFASTIEMMMKLEPVPKTVAMVSANDSFDVSVAKGTRELLAKAGLQLVVDQQYPEHNSEFAGAQLHPRGEADERQRQAALLVHRGSADGGLPSCARARRRVGVRHDAVASLRGAERRMVRRREGIREGVPGQVRLCARLPRCVGCR
jgi:branched-chain amino acid transport system substrate-binding protein